jgi:Polyketide cyclase / dehydrase and lipid transport
MTRWYSLEPADETVFATAAHVYRYPIRLSATPARVWGQISSDESLAAWGLGVRRLTWTSPPPYGVDTTREVVLPLGLVTLRERFFRWDEGKGYSFYVESMTRPGLRRFAEDYVVEAHGDGALLTWTIALEAKAYLTPMLAALGPVNRRALGQFGRAARKYFAEHPS